MKRRPKPLEAYYFYDGAARAFESAVDAIHRARRSKILNDTERLAAVEMALADLTREYDEQADLQMRFHQVEQEERLR